MRHSGASDQVGISVRTRSKILLGTFSKIFLGPPLQRVARESTNRPLGAGLLRGPSLGYAYLVNAI
jgi:hypothetical protein